MRRDEIESAYEVTDRGVIASPGKFEGEMIFAPHYYEQWTEGFADDLFNGAVAILEVSVRDRQRFPELDADTTAVALEETEQGFVYCTQITAEKLAELETASDLEAVEI